MFDISILLILLSNLPIYIQAYKIWKSKKTEGISVASFSLALLSNILWILFAYHKNYNEVVASSTLGAIGSFIVLMLILS